MGIDYLKYIKNSINNKDKEAFLIQFKGTDKTKETYATNLLKIYEEEYRLNKDISDFTKWEVLEMFKRLNTLSITSSRTLYHVCKAYAEWLSKEQGKTNVFESIEFSKEILSKNNNQDNLLDEIIKEDELWEIVKLAKNIQDVVCLVLPFYGVKGSRNSEMINLRKEDINQFGNSLKIKNEHGSERQVVLPQKVIELLVQASDETIYRKLTKGNKDSIHSLVDNEYILRSLELTKKKKESKKDNEKIRFEVINTRCKKLLESAGFSKVSLNDVYNSGKLHVLMKKKTKATTGDFKEVNKLFGDSEANYSNIKNLYLLVYGKYKNINRTIENNMNIPEIFKDETRGELINEYLILSKRLAELKLKKYQVFSEIIDKEIEEIKNKLINLLNNFTKEELIKLIKLELDM